MSKIHPMSPEEFVGKLRAKLSPDVFKAVCKMAEDGKMGFGSQPFAWGSRDGLL